MTQIFLAFSHPKALKFPLTPQTPFGDATLGAYYGKIEVIVYQLFLCGEIDDRLV
jgi:hypothetical protein